jgi:hypothetical protein
MSRIINNINILSLNDYKLSVERTAKTVENHGYLCKHLKELFLLDVYIMLGMVRVILLGLGAR